MIRRLKIRGFKSIKELEIRLDPVTVLVGRSGTGKSNVVRAIRFLRNVLLDLNAAVSCEGGWERITPAGEKASSFSIEIDFCLPGEELDFHYRISLDHVSQFHMNGPSEESLRIGTQTVFTRVRDGSPKQLKWEGPDLPPGFSWRDPAAPVLGQLPWLPGATQAYAAIVNGIGYYHFAASALASTVAAPNPEEFLRVIPGLSDDGSNYLEVIRSVIQDFHNPEVRKGLVALLQRVNPSILSVELDSLRSPQKAIVTHKNGEYLVPLMLEQESDGLRRFYAHLLALYQRPPKLTLIVEEPENAIFPGALSLLADEFVAAPRENRGQVILTTHSPTFLDSFDVENVRAVDIQDGVTVVGNVAKDQQDAVRDRLLSTGELLTIDNVRLEEAIGGSRAM